MALNGRYKKKKKKKRRCIKGGIALIGGQMPVLVVWPSFRVSASFSVS